MSNDYISREANGDDFVRRADIAEKFMDRLPSISVGYLCKIADEIPPADVRPVELINAGIETALQILDGANEAGWIQYPLYSELHDVISVIGDTAQRSADMREVKNDV